MEGGPEHFLKQEVMDLDAGVDRRLFSIVSNECRLSRALGSFFRHKLSELWVSSLKSNSEAICLEF